MVNYDEQNEEDPADVYTKAASIKMDFNREEPSFWFNQFETRMRMAGIKKQFTKLQILSAQLQSQPDVQAQIKPMLRVQENAAGNTCYKEAKDALMELFGFSEDERFNKAAALVLTSTPSALAKQIIDIICPNHPTLVDCCAAATVSGLWKNRLPAQIRDQIAGMKLGEGNLQATLRKADAVHKSMTSTIPVAALGANAAADSDEVAAANFAKNKWNKGQQGQKKNQGQKQNQGSGGQAQKGATSQGNAEKAPDGCCFSHRRYGKQAWFCRDEENCPWATFKVPRPKKQ